MTEERLPLARDENGDPISVPPEAVAWRVRRLTGRRGRPSAIYLDGRPLELPLDADVEDLEEAGCHAGRYRLEAIDQTGRVIPGVVALTVLQEDDFRRDSDDEPKIRVRDAWSVISEILVSNRELALANVGMMEKHSTAVQAMATAFGHVEPRHELARRDAGEDAPAGPAKSTAQTLAEIAQVAAPLITSAFTAVSAPKSQAPPSTPSPEAGGDS